jgi:alpha-tubulin suppressor-like RCC1 family protein
VLGGLSFRTVRVGSFHSCGVTTDNKAYCWGRNAEGEVGDSTTFSRRFRPRLVAGHHSFSRVIPGAFHTCGVTTTGKAFCWGAGADGQIGDGTTNQRRWPRAVAGGLIFSVVAGGSGHSCGLTTDNRAYCWGTNSSGELGDGTTATRLRPVAVIGGLHFGALVPGGTQTCALTGADKAYCWGNNEKGQLGDGTTTNRSHPVALTGNRLIDLVSTGGSEWFGHSCAVTTGGRAYCWGANSQGELGDGTTNDSAVPVAVMGL